MPDIVICQICNLYKLQIFFYIRRKVGISYFWTGRENYKEYCCIAFF